MTSATPTLQVTGFPVGPWMTNCYVLFTHVGGPCWLIDAGFEPAPLIDFIETRQLDLQQVILTHAHVDHIAGLGQVHDRWPKAPILIHTAERDFLTTPELNLSAYLDEPLVAPAATGLLSHGDAITLDGLNFEIRHTPGHSPGGITLYHADSRTAMVGDALFAGSIGRTDFPTSNHAQLIAAINHQLLTLPDDTTIYPGHGPTTTIGRERRSNPFLQ